MVTDIRRRLRDATLFCASCPGLLQDPDTSYVTPELQHKPSVHANPPQYMPSCTELHRHHHAAQAANQLRLLAARCHLWSAVDCAIWGKLESWWPVSQHTKQSSSPGTYHKASLSQCPEHHASTSQLHLSLQQEEKVVTLHTHMPCKTVRAQAGVEATIAHAGSLLPAQQGRETS